MTLRQTIAHARSLVATDSSQGFFIYRDRSEYGSGSRWELMGEQMYHEAPPCAESNVRAFVDRNGYVEMYESGQ